MAPLEAGALVLHEVDATRLVETLVPGPPRAPFLEDCGMT